MCPPMARSGPSMRGGVTGFVEHDVHPAGQEHRRDDAPSQVFGLATECDSLRRELGHCGCDVVAHEREIVARLVARMDTELRGREGEDEPTLPGVHVRPPKDI